MERSVEEMRDDPGLVAKLEQAVEDYGPEGRNPNPEMMEHAAEMLRRIRQIRLTEKRARRVRKKKRKAQRAARRRNR